MLLYTIHIIVTGVAYFIIKKKLLKSLISCSSQKHLTQLFLLANFCSTKFCNFIIDLLVRKLKFLMNFFFKLYKIITKQ